MTTSQTDPPSQGCTGWVLTGDKWHLKLKLSLSQKVGCMTEVVIQSAHLGWMALDWRNFLVNRLGRRRAAGPWSQHAAIITRVQVSPFSHRAIFVSPPDICGPLFLSRGLSSQDLAVLINLVLLRLWSGLFPSGAEVFSDA